MIELGSRRELFVDDYLIESLRGACRRLHQPVARELSLHLDRPWEGNTCAYAVVWRDTDQFRMYYRGSHWDWEAKRETHQVACYAESADGIAWTRPELGLCEFEGSRANNIVWTGEGTHNFTPFKDTNPECPPEARYKAIASIESDALSSSKGGIITFASPDGLRWRRTSPEPVITEGLFDSQNLAFWDAHSGQYREYHRGWRNNVRDIITCVSDDFVTWSEPVWLDYGDAPVEELYTNVVAPYLRAPQILLGLPNRFMPTRKKVPEHPYDGASDSVLMSSRDGLRFTRWQEAFLRPGPQRERWWERNNYIAWGMLVTGSDLPGAPDELSFYANEGHYEDTSLRRFTLRMDGFVSVWAPMSGGELLTRPLRFAGRRLELNYATSAAGSIRAEICDAAGLPLEGYRLEDCPELYGDGLDEAVVWSGGEDVGGLAGQEVRLRFELRDADLYAIRFAGGRGLTPAPGAKG